FYKAVRILSIVAVSGDTFIAVALRFEAIKSIFNLRPQEISRHPQDLQRSDISNCTAAVLE
ncbi:hypothetical protein, partial [Mesorhizobium delmotii]|uniref:hypothetical protein n=1 Tax=Mesorhizobium delmotii TaxID=1631247 RepID=UPI001AD80174